VDENIIVLFVGPLVAVREEHTPGERIVVVGQFVAFEVELQQCTLAVVGVAEEQFVQDANIPAFVEQPGKKAGHYILVSLVVVGVGHNILVLLEPFVVVVVVVVECTLPYNESVVVGVAVGVRIHAFEECYDDGFAVDAHVFVALDAFPGQLPVSLVQLPCAQLLSP
jgi:hypothetical protein